MPLASMINLNLQIPGPTPPAPAPPSGEAPRPGGYEWPPKPYEKEYLYVDEGGQLQIGTWRDLELGKVQTHAVVQTAPVSARMQTAPVSAAATTAEVAATVSSDEEKKL